MAETYQPQQAAIVHPSSPANVAADLEAVYLENQTILQARARILARKKGEEDHGGERLEVVEFLVNDEKYAIELVHIGEVFPLGELTELPGVPPFVLGVVNLRGQIISVNDIRRFFDIPAKGISDKSRIIVLASATMEFGILADSILGTRSVRIRDMVAAMPTLTGIRAQFLKGITREHTVILDGAKLLNDSEIVIK